MSNNAREKKILSTSSLFYLGDRRSQMLKNKHLGLLIIYNTGSQAS